MPELEKGDIEMTPEEHLDNLKNNPPKLDGVGWIVQKPSIIIFWFFPGFSAMSLLGKVALVTGASSGIGAATAVHLARWETSSSFFSLLFPLCNDLTITFRELIIPPLFTLLSQKLYLPRATFCISYHTCRLWKWRILIFRTWFYKFIECIDIVEDKEGGRRDTRTLIQHSVSLWYLGDETDNHHK